MTSLLTHARLNLAYVDSGTPLLRFAFNSGDDDASPLCIPCEHLAGPTAPESWFAGEISESAQTHGAAWAHGEHYAMVAISVEEQAGDIEHAATRAYQRLLTCVRPSAHPFFLRIWNYFSAINVGGGDQERYRRFCVGRAASVDDAFNQPPPAATAIGVNQQTPYVQIIALCARAPTLALENPRQTPAWRYPREFGPVAPGFSRGIVLDTDTDRPRLLVSGTASIVGHVSCHIGDTAAQLRESLANLQALFAEAQAQCQRRFSLGHCESLRVYLRNPQDLAIAQAIIAESALPAEHVLYLRGDVCRRELDVEIEGVFVADCA